MSFRNFLRKPIVKSFRYRVEGLVVRFGLWFFGIMNVKTASNIAANISKFIGKKISVNKLANSNIAKALPELSRKEIDVIIDDMWDNLGRIVGEFIHISNTNLEDLQKFIQLSDESRKNIEELKNSGKGGIIFSGHIGNWEVGPKLFKAMGLNVATLYRPLNNPYVEEMTAKLRGVELIEKSINGSRKIVETIKKGGFVIILADQKVSEGESIEFFHDKAITTTSIARIALKYDIALVPARSIRVDKNFKFIVEVEKPLDFQKTKDINLDISSLTRKINCKLEDWIRQYPAQWFWVHNRWK